MDKELVSCRLIQIECSYYKFIASLAVYVYVYLTGQTVNQAGGGTIINWSSTYEATDLLTILHFIHIFFRIGGPQFHEGDLDQRT